MTPEHIHVATNHLPFLGLGLAIIPLLVGLLVRSKPALVSGLLLTFICGGSVFLVVDTGKEAGERYLQASQHNIQIDMEAKAWVEAHGEDAQLFAKVMYAAAGVATLALLIAITGSSMVYPIAWIVVILNVASLAAGFLVADSGGKIRRPDFRAEMRIESPAEQLADTIHGPFDVLS